MEGLPPALRSAYPDLLADYVASVIKKGDERPANRQAQYRCSQPDTTRSLHAGMCCYKWQTGSCRNLATPCNVYFQQAALKWNAVAADAASKVGRPGKNACGAARQRHGASRYPSLGTEYWHHAMTTRTMDAQSVALGLVLSAIQRCDSR